MTRFKVKVGEVELEYEGEPAEVRERYEQALEWMRTSPRTVQSEPKSTEKAEEEKRSYKKTGEMKILTERLAELRKEKFFDTPKGLQQIRKELQTRGWYHISPNIQAALLRRGADLGIKRVIDGGSYGYVRV